MKQIITVLELVVRYASLAERVATYCLKELKEFIPVEKVEQTEKQDNKEQNADNGNS